MGFLSKLFKVPEKPKIKILSADEAVDLWRMGYKVNMSHEYFAPDTVWVGPHSKVYHVKVCCGRNGQPVDGAIPLPESEAVRRHLRRCKLCKWDTPVPEPGKEPVSCALPVGVEKRGE